VDLISRCPRSSFTVIKLAPLANSNTAYVWRAQWKVIFLLILAASSNFLSSRLICPTLNCKLKTRSSSGGLSPTSLKAVSFYGIRVMLPVFACRFWIANDFPLPLKLVSLICDHFRLAISPYLNPVKHENKKARLTTS